MIIFLTKALETTFSIYFCLVLKVVPYKVFLMYLFKAKIAFSDHAFPGLKTVKSKMPLEGLCGGGIEFKFSLTYVRALVKEDKTIEDCIS